MTPSHVGVDLGLRPPLPTGHSTPAISSVDLDVRPVEIDSVPSNTSTERRGYG